MSKARAERIHQRKARTLYCQSQQLPGQTTGRNASISARPNRFIPNHRRIRSKRRGDGKCETITITTRRCHFRKLVKLLCLSLPCAPGFSSSRKVTAHICAYYANGFPRGNLWQVLGVLLSILMPWQPMERVRALVSASWAVYIQRLQWEHVYACMLSCLRLLA